MATSNITTTQIDSPDTGITTFVYGNSSNDAGQLLSQTDATGRMQAYSYDDNGRLIAITDGDNQTIAQYRYDELGRLSTLSNPASTTTYTYDSAGRVIEKVQTLTQTSDGQQSIVRYAYTAGGKLTQQRLPSGKLVVYQYDNGVLTGIEVKHDESVTQVIDNLTYSPNGITGFNWSQTDKAVSYAYDLDGRLTNISDPALSRQYSYDAGNRITSILDNNANINYGYEHDKLDRLLEQNLQEISLAYAYDKNSNRTLSKTVTPTETDINNISYEPTSNRIVGVSYDASGRILNDGQRTYTYNSAGRIERIQAGAVGVFNAYNPLGRRIQKNSGDAKIYFVYDESGLLIGEYDQTNNPIREYVYLGGQPIALISNEKDGELLQIHSDHLGTPRAVTSASNEILWRMEGDQFGDVEPSIEQVKLPLRHAGQYADSETGLFYNYFRFYDPKTGRYVTSDPIGLDGGLNTYGYVYGSPLNYVDPTGEFGVAGAVIGGLFNISTQIGLNLLASDWDWGRSLRCIDLADFVLSAALGAAGPGIGNFIKKPPAGAIFTRRENAFMYGFMVQPASVASKQALNLRVTDLIDDDCQDDKCDELAIPEALAALKLLQF